MKSIFSSKKAVFVFCFIIIILLFAGFYFLIEKGIFWMKKEVSNKKNDTLATSADISTFEIKNVNGVNIIENEKEGFLAQVPENWIIKKFKYQGDENEISLFSPESEFDEQGNFISKKSYLENKACAIGISIIKCEKYSPNVLTDADMLLSYIKSIKDESDKNNKLDNDWNIIKISEKDTLKKITKRDDKIIAVKAEVPIGQIIYSFSTGYIVNQNCVKYFDNFLKTVLINK